ncbi:hypothetical protein, partial [Corynebacterium stationis]|uniref:hypothetical protein n=1 Tax=Corynebacterium stationis TaxID=1705 RepID=UPI0025B77D0E
MEVVACRGNFAVDGVDKGRRKVPHSPELVIRAGLLYFLVVVREFFPIRVALLKEGVAAFDGFVGHV